MGDLDAQHDSSSCGDDADGMAGAAPILSSEKWHGQSLLGSATLPRVGRFCGTFINRRSGPHTLALHLFAVMPSRRPPCGGSHSGRLPASDTGRHGGRYGALSCRRRRREEPIAFPARPAMGMTRFIIGLGPSPANHLGGGGHRPRTSRRSENLIRTVIVSNIRRSEGAILLRCADPPSHKAQFRNSNGMNRIARCAAI